MPGLLTLLIVALAAAALTAVVSGVVVLRRAGRLDVRRGVASAALLACTGAGAVLGVAALHPSAPPHVEPVSAVTPVDVQLPTLALDD